MWSPLPPGVGLENPPVPAFAVPVPAHFRGGRACPALRDGRRPLVPTSVPVARPQRPLRLPASMAAAKKKVRNWSPRVENRAARMRYEFLEVFECGIELVGSEIKSVRHGKMNIKEGYARVQEGELFLHNVHITPWENAGSYFNHEATRVRKLLLHKKDIRKLGGKQADTGLTIVPTKAYFNEGGYLKIEVALARGKQLHDRRQDIKKREGDREMKRVVKASLGVG